MPVKAINFTLFIPTLAGTNISHPCHVGMLFTDFVLVILDVHCYLLSGDDQPVCSICQSPLTVEHFLVECVNFAAIHSRYFSAFSMKDVFENVNAQSVIDFIKEMHFYHKL